MIIKNFEVLVNAGKSVCSNCLRARRYILECLNVGVKSADPEKAVHRFLKVKDGTIYVGEFKYRPKRVFVVGCGKASCKMAKAVEDILGDMIEDGVIAVHEKFLEHCMLERIRTIKAQHPIPGPGSLEAGDEILKLVSNASQGDLVITLISGGGSALMEKLAPNISLKDLEELTNQLDYEDVLKNLQEVLKNPALEVKEPLSSRCKPCEAGTPALAKDTVEKLLAQHRGWELREEKKLRKEFKFKDFIEAKYFVDLVSAVAEEQGHHPTITIIYNKVRITLTTNASGGLTENDFIMAKITDEIAVG